MDAASRVRITGPRENVVAAEGHSFTRSLPTAILKRSCGHESKQEGLHLGNPQPSATMVYGDLRSLALPGMRRRR